jgi:hypothetical protein
MSGYPMRVVELISGENQQFDRLFGGALCLSTIALSADTVITPNPCLLYGYAVHVATGVGLITIKNGTSSGGGTTRITIPVGKPVGEYALPVAIDCPNGLFVGFNGGATGSITVLYLPIA